MKTTLKNLIVKGLIVGSVFCGLAKSDAQTQLLLDPTQNWIGYVNVFNLPANGGGYQFGSAWAPAALSVYYDTATAPYHTLTVIANTNTYNPNDPYWVTNGAGNKTVDASYYVQNDTLAGQNLTFSGFCISNTFISPYTSTVFIKDFNSGYGLVASAVANTTNGQPFSISLQTASGDHIQYGFETIGPDVSPTNPFSVGNALYQVQYPAIEPSAMNGQAAVVGQNVSFIQTPSGNGPFTYQWAFNGSPLANSSHIAGATASTLIISNVTGTDAGTYSVAITNASAVGASASAPLAIIPLAQAQTNYAIDPSFESDTFAPASSVGWFSYGGTAFANTDEWYSVFDPAPFPDVSAIDGSNCLVEYSGGANSYTGVFQDRPALPGQVYTAYAWYYTPDANAGYPIINSANANLQVQFHDAGGNLLVDYESTPFTTNFPVDTWIYMPVTNEYAADFVTLLGTGPYIVSPPGTASMRIQPGYHAPDAASAGDVYIDMVDVNLVETTPTPSVSGTIFKLAFPTLYGPQYNVLYRTNLVAGSWQTLSSVTGDGTVKTVTDTVGSTPRFYIVNTSP